MCWLSLVFLKALFYCIKPRSVFKNVALWTIQSSRQTHHDSCHAQEPSQHQRSMRCDDVLDHATTALHTHTHTHTHTHKRISTGTPLTSNCGGFCLFSEESLLKSWGFDARRKTLLSLDNKAEKTLQRVPLKGTEGKRPLWAGLANGTDYVATKGKRFMLI